MRIFELSIIEFNNFALKHPMRNYCQSIDYALFMGELGYEYELIGYGNSKDDLSACSLILTKKIGYSCYYGYAPKGFLMDYSNNMLLKNFTQALIEYYEDRDFAFIKINPEIAIGEVNPKSFLTQYNVNNGIAANLENLGYLPLKKNLNFESLFPRFTGIMPLKDFSINSVSKNTRNKIAKSLRHGLEYELVGIDKLSEVEKFFIKKEDYYYNDLYNVFAKNNKVDLFLIKINPERFLVNAQNAYVSESTRNSELNQKMVENNKESNINNKMNSDRTLLTYKNEITEASKMLTEGKNVCIAGAMVIKDGTRIHIIASGYDKDYSRFMPNYYLYFTIMNYYRNEFRYVDLEGLSGDFSKDSPYYGLNHFKLGFNPKIYELIGEYDLIIDEKTYKILLKDKLLSKEFSKN